MPHFLSEYGGTILAIVIGIVAIGFLGSTLVQLSSF